MLIIGSRALEAYTDIGRKPADCDIVGEYKEMLQLVAPYGNKQMYPIDGGSKYVLKSMAGIVEFEIAWPGSTAEMMLKLNGGHIFGRTMAAPVELLLALKLSHRFKKSKHFMKTMDDIRLMRKMGVVVPDTEAYREFMRRRTAEALSYNHPKLNVSKDQFFSGSVKYIYDHDSIHEAVKHQDRPAYEYFKPLGQEVFTSRVMFENCSHDIKLHAVLEEAYVLALERSQIPYREQILPIYSFRIALEKVCTSITSGWFREFAWEHYHEVLALYNDNYVDRFWRDVAADLVPLHNAAGTEGTGLATNDHVAGVLG